MDLAWQPIALNDLVEMLDEATGTHRYTRCPRGRLCIRHRRTGEVSELDLRVGTALRIRKSPARELAELITH